MLTSSAINIPPALKTLLIALATSTQPRQETPGAKLFSCGGETSQQAVHEFPGGEQMMSLMGSH